MFSDVIYQHCHVSPLSMQRLRFLVLLGWFNIFRWYFTSKIQADLEHFLMHSSGRRNWLLHSGKFISAFPKLWGTLRPRAPAGLCILPAHPGPCLRVLAIPRPFVSSPGWYCCHGEKQRERTTGYCPILVCVPTVTKCCFLLASGILVGFYLSWGSLKTLRCF